MSGEPDAAQRPAGVTATLVAVWLMANLDEFAQQRRMLVNELVDKELATETLLAGVQERTQRVVAGRSASWRVGARGVRSTELAAKASARCSEMRTRGVRFLCHLLVTDGSRASFALPSAQLMSGTVSGDGLPSHRADVRIPTRRLT